MSNDGSSKSTSYPFLIVDAFAGRPLEGNPCAVVLDADGLDAGTMQALARETNLSETAFVVRPSSGHDAFAARYFTPETEIPFAGHPTVATVRALVDTDRVGVGQSDTTVLPDTIEDPFTGSATGATAAHLWRHDVLDEPRFVAEQGHDMGRPGRAHVEVMGDRSKIRAVRVGGSAVTVVRGTLQL